MAYSREVVDKGIFDLSPEAMVVVSKSGKVVDVNNRVSDWLGYEADEVIGKGFMSLEFISLKSKTKAIANLAKRFAGVEIKPYQMEFVKKDGERVLGLARGSLVKNDEGEEYDLVMISEITEVVQEKEKSESEREKIREYIDLAGVLFIALDEKGNITLANKEACEVLGSSEEELLGKNWFETAVPEEQRKEISEVFEKITSGEVEGVEWYENEVLTKSGEKRMIAWHNTSLKNDKGDVIGLLGSGEDVTEKRQQENLLRQSESKMRAIFDNSPDAIYVYDKAGNFIDGNRKAEELTGYKKEELIGKSFLKLGLLPKKQIPLAAKNIAEVAMGKPTGPDNFELTRKDGEKIVLETRSYPIEIDGKKFFMGMARDTTELSETKLKLSESERKSKTLYENMNEGVAFHKIIRNDEGQPYDYKITQANLAFENNTGLKLDQVVGKLSTEAFGVEKPPFFEKYLKVVTTRNAEKFEEYFKPLNRYFSISATPSGDDEFITVFSDITDEKIKNLELQKFKLGLEKSKDIVFITDSEGIFEYVNPTFEKTYGYNKEELEGKTPRVLKSGKHDKGFYENFWRTIKEGNTIEIELTNKNKEGRLIIVRSSVVPIGEDNIVGYLTLQRDVTRQIEQEKKSKERSEQLEKINKLMVGREIKMAELKEKLSKYEPESYARKKDDVMYERIEDLKRETERVSSEEGKNMSKRVEDEHEQLVDVDDVGEGNESVQDNIAEIKDY